MDHKHVWLCGNYAPLIHWRALRFSTVCLLDIQIIWTLVQTLGIWLMETNLQPIHIIYFGIGLLAILVALKLHDKWLARKHRKFRGHKPPSDDELLK